MLTANKDVVVEYNYINKNLSNKDDFDKWINNLKKTKYNLNEAIVNCYNEIYGRLYKLFPIYKENPNQYLVRIRGFNDTYIIPLFTSDKKDEICAKIRIRVKYKIKMTDCEFNIGDKVRLDICGYKTFTIKGIDNYNSVCYYTIGSEECNDFCISKCLLKELLAGDNNEKS